MRPYVLGIVLAVALACVEPTEQSAPTYSVTYDLTKSPTVSGLFCDSVRYENADGQLITVPNPSFPWTSSFSAPAGKFIRATAWIMASGGGQSAKLKMTWRRTLDGASGADSLFGTTTAPGAFALDLTRRELP